ncbi:MAG: hypothetical protein QG628_717, partial [Patescibacteria group bacterium]|nr:hypothetical protein [Patescibacteria group bacterium]
AQLVEQRLEEPCVLGSSPRGATICGCSSVDRALPCQGRGHEFESRHPHQIKKVSKEAFFIWL